MKIIDSDQFIQEVVNSDIPVLVEFSASWCQPCKIVEPILEKIEKEYEGKFKVVTVVTDDPYMATRLPLVTLIANYPSFFIYHKGKAREQFSSTDRYMILAKMDTVLHRISDLPQ